MKDNEHIIILVAEDDDGHAELIQECFEETGIRNPFLRFRDGQEAWEFLAGRGLDAEKSYLLMLDIRMPRMTGVELLRRMKTSEELKKIPVIMLTTTDDPKEIEECYQLGCSSYITKPIDFHRFVEVLRRVGLFISIIQVPSVVK